MIRKGKVKKKKSKSQSFLFDPGNSKVGKFKQMFCFICDVSTTLFRVTNNSELKGAPFEIFSGFSSNFD